MVAVPSNLDDAAETDDSDPTTRATRTVDLQSDKLVLVELRSQVNAQLSANSLAPLALNGSVAPASMFTSPVIRGR